MCELYRKFDLYKLHKLLLRHTLVISVFNSTVITKRNLAVQCPRNECDSVQV